MGKNITSQGVQPIIPYPSNQKPAEAEFLRVDRKFKAHGPEEALRLQGFSRKTISRLKQHISLENHKPTTKKPQTAITHLHTSA